MYSFENFPELLSVFQHSSSLAAGNLTFFDFTNEQTFFYRSLPDGQIEVRVFLRYTVDLVDSKNPFDSMYGIGVTEGPSSQGYPVTIRPTSISEFDASAWYDDWGNDDNSKLSLARWRSYISKPYSTLSNVRGVRLDPSGKPAPVPIEFDLTDWEI